MKEDSCTNILFIMLRKEKRMIYFIEYQGLPICRANQKKPAHTKNVKQVSNLLTNIKAETTKRLNRQGITPKDSDFTVNAISTSDFYGTEWPK